MRRYGLAARHQSQKRVLRAVSHRHRNLPAQETGSRIGQWLSRQVTDLVRVLLGDRKINEWWCRASGSQSDVRVATWFNCARTKLEDVRAMSNVVARVISLVHTEGTAGI